MRLHFKFLKLSIQDPNICVIKNYQLANSHAFFSFSGLQAGDVPCMAWTQELRLNLEKHQRKQT
jgi:hypothetical protein